MARRLLVTISVDALYRPAGHSAQPVEFRAAWAPVGRVGRQALDQDATQGENEDAKRSTGS